MKAVILIGFLVAYVHGLNEETTKFIEEIMDKLQDFAATCAEETHATSDDIAELLARKMPPSTHEGKCMLFCISKSINFMKPDGSLNRAGALTGIAPLKKADPALHEKVLKIFVYCGMNVKPDADPCETATKLTMCAQKQAEAAGVDDSLIG